MKPKVHHVSAKVTGQLHAGYDPFTGKPFKMVYQRVRKGLGNLADNGRMGVQLRVQAAITDKKSTRQLQCRARLAAATAAWQALTPAQQDAYRELAKASHMTGFNCFVSQFSQQHPLSAY